MAAKGVEGVEGVPPSSVVQDERAGKLRVHLKAADLEEAQDEVLVDRHSVSYRRLRDSRVLRSGKGLEGKVACDARLVTEGLKNPVDGCDRGKRPNRQIERRDWVNGSRRMGLLCDDKLPDVDVFHMCVKAWTRPWWGGSSSLTREQKIEL